ncbi:MAG TPA: chromate transporter [Caldimonas sp.]|jgi:chromate transporter
MLLELALYFGLLSLISVGGMPSVIPEMQRYVVEVKQWISAADFIQMFAVGQAAPGPNVLISGLIGWKVAGLAGACVALAAMCLPAGVVAFWVADLWERMKDSPWRKVAQRAMAPMVVGLILSGGFVLATPSGTPDWRLWLIAVASAAAMLTTKLNPLWLLAGGGVLGGLLL